MNNKELQSYLSRFTEEIKSDKYRFDLRDRFVVAWTLFSRIPLPKKWWPAEMPPGNRTLSIAPTAGGILGLLTGIVIGLAGILGDRKAWISVDRRLLLRFSRLVSPSGRMG